MKKICITISILIFCTELILGQKFISADPFKILEIEKQQFTNLNSSSNLLIRPILMHMDSVKWSISYRSELYFNNNAPNFENFGNRFIGNGLGVFTGVNFSYSGKYLSFSVEPFYFYSQNNDISLDGRDGIFSNLNDASYLKKSPYTSVGIRESQIYLHYNNFGFGFSNANMWWGPGIHNSLTMTNNTTGFPILMIGTLREKRYKNLGFNFRYVFSQLDKTIGDPYFTALVGALRYYSNPIINNQ